MSSVLYRNEDSTVFLLDIPTSIAEAQGWQLDQQKRLMSSEPLSHPYKATEPKSERARKNVLKGDTHDDLQKVHTSSITNALLSIKKGYGGDWCIARCTVPTVSLGKRNASVAGLEDFAGSQQVESPITNANGWNAGVDLENMLKALSVRGEGATGAVDNSTLHIVYRNIGKGSALNISDTVSPAEDNELSTGVLIQNPDDQVAQAIVSLDSEYVFWVPPKSMAILGKCDDSGPLREALRKGLLTGATSSGCNRKFDLVLLDPPWPNRSARRKKSYETQYSMRNTVNLLYGMDLDIHLAADGYVGVWITNKVAVCDLILGDDGIGSGGWFESLGVELVEEWLWVKTTIHGEPISDLHGIWRKPYEVLLIGKQNNGLPTAVANDQTAEIKRRVFAAVPDLHSRKPCLKEIFGELLFDGRPYRALEVFARCMIAGWCSWGDEAIKYNWESHWN